MSWPIALLGAGCCILLGGRQARQAGERAALLEQWNGALMRMACALEAGGHTLHQLLEAGDMPFLQAGAQLLQDQPTLSPAQWLDRLPWDPHLTPAERAVLQDGLQGLFHPLPARQQQEMEYARKLFAPLVKRAREGAEKNMGLYRALGWLSGAAVFILIC